MPERNSKGEIDIKLIKDRAVTCEQICHGQRVAGKKGGRKSSLLEQRVCYRE